MPFTPAHAVVALPFVRTPLVPAAIAIGAMTPDIPLFFRTWPPLRPHAQLDRRRHDRPRHSRSRCCSSGGSCSGPPSSRSRRAGSRCGGHGSGSRSGGVGGGASGEAGARPGAGGVVAGVLLVASMLIGAVTHVVWDAFTHTDRWGTHLLPFLDERTGPFFNADIAHWISSIIGLGIIATWGLRWLRRQDAAALALATPTWSRVLVWLSLPASLRGRIRRGDASSESRAQTRSGAEPLWHDRSRDLPRFCWRSRASWWPGMRRDTPGMHASLPTAQTARRVITRHPKGAETPQSVPASSGDKPPGSEHRFLL